MTDRIPTRQTGCITARGNGLMNRTQYIDKAPSTANAVPLPPHGDGFQRSKPAASQHAETDS